MPAPWPSVIFLIYEHNIQKLNFCQFQSICTYKSCEYVYDQVVENFEIVQENYILDRYI